MRDYKRLYNENTSEIRIGHLESLRESLTRVYEEVDQSLKQIERIADGESETLIKDIAEYAAAHNKKLAIIATNLDEYLNEEEN